MRIRVKGDRVPLHAATIAKALGDDGAGDAEWRLLVFPHPRNIPELHTFRSHGHKVAAYWIGSDAYAAGRRSGWDTLPLLVDRNICCHERLVADIEHDAVVVPFLSRERFEQTSPGDPRVAVYMPSNGPKYGFEDCCDLARRLPDLPFVFYGNKGPLPSVPENVQCVGWLTDERVTLLLSVCSVVLRWTVHDGLPQNIIEAKMMGRHVVSSYPYHGCLDARTVDEAEQWLLMVCTHEADESAVPRWYRDNCSPEAFARNMRAALA